MTKPELGVKRDCPECGARFYDLNKEPAHCPKCDHEFVPEALLKPRRAPKDDEKPAAANKEDPAKPEAETSLESADKEKKAAESKRRASLDDDDDDDDDGEDLPEIEDIDVDLDDDDDDDEDDSLLDDDDVDEDVSTIVKPGGDDD